MRIAIAALAALAAPTGAGDSSVFGIELGKPAAFAPCPVPKQYTPPAPTPEQRLADQNAQRERQRKAKEEQERRKQADQEARQAYKDRQVELREQRQKYANLPYREQRAAMQRDAEEARQEAAEKRKKDDAEKAQRQREARVQHQLTTMKQEEAEKARRQAEARARAESDAEAERFRLGDDPCVAQQARTNDTLLTMLGLMGFGTMQNDLKATGALQATRDEVIIAIQLPQKRCPDWANCRIYATIERTGAPTAVFVNAAPNPKYVAELMTAKYGKPTGRSQNGNVIDWNVRAVHARLAYTEAYQWLDEGTTRTSPASLVLFIELARRQKARATADEQHEKAQPKL